VGEISVAKSGGTKKISSAVSFHRTPTVLAVPSVSISRKSVVRRYELIFLLLLEVHFYNGIVNNLEPLKLANNELSVFGGVSSRKDIFYIHMISNDVARSWMAELHVGCQLLHDSSRQEWRAIDSKSYRL